MNSQIPGLFAFEYGVRGLSHIRENKPYQDAHYIQPVMIEKGIPFINKRSFNSCILVIADGHGSAKYEYSDIGSKLAVFSAAKVLKVCFEEYVKLYLKEGKTFALNQFVKSWKNEVPRQIYKEWGNMVKEDYYNRTYVSQTPMVNEDIQLNDQTPSDPAVFLAEDSNEADGDKAQVELKKLYGTTLSCSLITQEGLFFAQIGDGDILVIYPDGTVEQPIPVQNDTIGDETYSLCMEKSYKYFNTGIILDHTSRENSENILVWLSTDGFNKSFETDQGFEDYVRSLYEYTCLNSFKTMTDGIPKILDNLTQNGSGDDISVVIAMIKNESLKEGE
ncbi:MAG: protein phosphatase 2C domain-containing protein [Eubacteriales bacterium]|nr:protein phosphatase 2C domain-containing protein [Eubacteriales bacterium]